MHTLIELIAGIVAMLAAAALAQFGVDLNASRAPDREVHRVPECGDSAASTALTSEPTRDC